MDPETSQQRSCSRDPAASLMLCTHCLKAGGETIMYILQQSDVEIFSPKVATTSGIFTAFLGQPS